MKRLLFLSVVLMTGVMACSSCAKKSQTSAQPDVATCTDASCPIKLPEAGTETVNDVIQEDNWQFTLPGSGWVSVKPPDDTIKVIFANQETNTIVFLAKDPTTQTSSEYIINALRSFKAAGTLIQSAQQVSITDTNFIMVTAQGETRKIWTWISVQKGFGYIFTCAADNSNADTGAQRCQDIANTLQIR